MSESMNFDLGLGMGAIKLYGMRVLRANCLDVAQALSIWERDVICEIEKCLGKTWRWSAGLSWSEGERCC